ncbi:hypothetical protein JW964_25335 [candidate division KSB1 bacterium]|nr:hypothetical protein [candidate division KSB1 bacterium]
MITRENIIDRIQKMPEPYLIELYEIIKSFEASKKKAKSKPSLMSQLRNIKISAPSDFSQTADLYVAGDDTKE